MKYREIVIETEPLGIEPLSDLLVNCDIDGFVVDDERDFNEFIEKGTAYWDYVDEQLAADKKGACRLKFYISEDEKGAADLARVRAAVAKSSGFKAELLESKGDFDDVIDANAWKKYYKPIEIGQKLLIVPEWEKIVNPEGRVVFSNNPGMAFGSGSHASTRMCIEELEKRTAVGMQLYDLGCGSGILAIIAALLGCARVFGVDIDPNAAEVSYENAERNHVSERCDFTASNLLSDAALLEKLATHPADIVVANIVADVIIALAPAALRLVKAGGLFISSGIIDTREDEVKAAILAAGFEILEIRALDGWRCIVARAV